MLVNGVDYLLEWHISLWSIFELEYSAAMVDL